MTIAIITVVNAIFGGVWILLERKARRKRERAATGQRLADVIAEGRYATYYTPALSPREIAELNSEEWPD